MPRLSFSVFSVVLELGLAISRKRSKQGMRLSSVKIEPIREISVNCVSSFLAKLPKSFFQTLPIVGARERLVLKSSPNLFTEEVKHSKMNVPPSSLSPLRNA